MTKTLCDEIGEELYNSVLDSCCARLSLGKRRHAVKNPIVIKELLSEADKVSKACESLNQIVTQIVALRESLSSSNKQL